MRCVVLNVTKTEVPFGDGKPSLGDGKAGRKKEKYALAVETV
jgi:hypothetical protein